MRRLLPALPALIAAVLVVLIVSPTSANAPLVKPVRGNTYTLSPDNRQATLWVPLEMDAGIDLATTVEADVIDFSRAGVSTPAIRGAVEVNFANPENAAPRLGIDVKLKPLTPASYNLRVGLAFTHKAAGKPNPESKSESVDLVLVYKAAKLLQPSPLFVRKTDAFLWPRKEEKNELELELTTLDTELHDWEIVPVGVTDPDGNPLSSGISVTPQPLLDRGRVTLPLATAGSFPLGKSKGKVRIKSDELEAPIEVAFEVERQRSKGWIWIVLSLGLVLGLLFRVVNANLELLNERDDTVTKLKELRAESKDATFQELIGKAIEPLKEARLPWRSGKPAREAMTKAIKDALAELKGAQENFVKRRGEEQAKLDAFAKLVGTDYEPTPGVAEDLGTARASNTSARQVFEDGNVVEAQRLRSEAERKLEEDSRRHLGEFVTEATKAGGRKGKLDIAKGVLAYVVKIEPVKTARTAWNNALKLVAPGTEAKSVLKAAHDLWRAETDFARKLYHHLDSFLGEAIERVGGEHGKPLVGLRQKIEDETKDKPPHEVTSAIVAIEDLTETVNAALKAAVDPAHKDALDQALSEGEYYKALTIVQLPPPPKTATVLKDLLYKPGEWKEGTVMLHYEAAGGGGQQTDVWEQVQLARSAWDEDEVPGAEPAEPRLLEALAAPDLPAPDLVIRRAATEVLGWLAWLLSFAVLVITGYVTFQKGFVGKWPEFIPIFLWAFGLDIGVNTMLAKGLKKA